MLADGSRVVPRLHVAGVSEGLRREVAYCVVDAGAEGLRHAPAGGEAVARSRGELRADPRVAEVGDGDRLDGSLAPARVFA